MQSPDEQAKDELGAPLAFSRTESFTAKQRNLALLRMIPDALKNLKDSCRTFANLRKSLFLERKQKSPNDEDIFVCECLRGDLASPEQLADSSLSLDCGEKCINRLICTECEGKSCPCGERCQNRRFQLQQDMCVYPFRAGSKGWGLRAGEPIPKGAFVLQYVGEIYFLKSELGLKRLAQYAKSVCTYLMKLSAREVIDPTFKGNIARFINHSCEPNCLTQKWNVLGEVAVGIFALRDIEAGEELTFDYKFDVYRTPLCLCLCGTASCKGYLGLRPTEYSPEEWEYKMDNLPCEICKGNYENDDDHLLVCDKCNNGFHLECLTPKLLAVPKGAWFCPECLAAQPEQTAAAEPEEKEPVGERTERKVVPGAVALAQERLEMRSDLKSRMKNQFSENKEQISKIFDQMFRTSECKSLAESWEFREQLNKTDQPTEYKQYLLSPMELAVFKERGSKIISLTATAKLSMFWNASDSSYRNVFVKQIELTIIATSRQVAFVEAVLKLIEESVKSFRENSGIVEKCFKIPAIFLKRVLGEYYCNLKAVEKEFNVKIHFNKSHITDDCYPIHFLTSIILKGKSENITQAHGFVRGRMRELVARRKYMSRGDIKVIIGRLSAIKKEISPTEIRCCRDNALRDINHPFYTIYYKDKEVAFIGTAEEVLRADRRVGEIIEHNRRHAEISLSLNFLIPVCDKHQLIAIKNKNEKLFPGNKMIIYDPLHPRKNVSITLSSTYQKFDEYLEHVKKQLEGARLYYVNFESYQIQMLYQMSKYFFKYIQNFKQTRSMVFMKSWDTITAEFDEHSLGYKSALQILLPSIVKDLEFRFYILGVNSLYKEERLAKIGLPKGEFLEILKNTLLRKNDGFMKNFTIFAANNSQSVHEFPVYTLQNLTGSNSEKADTFSHNFDVEGEALADARLTSVANSDRKPGKAPEHFAGDFGRLQQQETRITPFIGNPITTKISYKDSKRQAQQSSRNYNQADNKHRRIADSSSRSSRSFSKDVRRKGNKNSPKRSRFQSRFQKTDEHAESRKRKEYGDEIHSRQRKNNQRHPDRFLNFREKKYEDQRGNDREKNRAAKHKKYDSSEESSYERYQKIQKNSKKARKYSGSSSESYEERRNKNYRKENWKRRESYGDSSKERENGAFEKGDYNRDRFQNERHKRQKYD